MPRLLPVLLALCAVLSAPARAQYDPGDIGIFGDAEGNQPTIDISGFSLQSIYLVAFDPPGGMEDLRVTIVGMESSGFTVLAVELLSPGVRIDSATLEFVVDFDACTEGEVVPLARIDFGYFVGPVAPSDNSICIGWLEGDFRPNYLDCGGIRQNFGLAQDGGLSYPDGCLIINPTPPQCCPSSDQFFRIPARLGVPGDTVRLPLQSDLVFNGCKTSCFFDSDMGFGGTLEFDPQKLRFLGATLGSDVPDWNLAVTPLEPGRVLVRALAEGAEVDWGRELPDLDYGTLLGFDFEVLAGGTTPVTLANAGVCRVWGGWAPPCVFLENLNLVGAITQDPVGVETTNFGALKARFRD